MIRDQLVIGIQDSRLSERLQMDPDLTLEKAKKLIRQSEAVDEHQVSSNKQAMQTNPQQWNKFVTRPLEEQIIHKPETHRISNSLNVNAVETSNIYYTNVLQETPHAINAREKVTTVVSAFQKQLMTSQQSSWKKI